MNAVAKNIKRLRKQAGMTQETLAEQLHVTRQAVSGWETAKTQPDIETLTALAEALGTDVNGLIYGPRPDPEGYAPHQRKYVVCAAVCAVLTAAWVFMEVWGLSYIEQSAWQGSSMGLLLWPYTVAVRPLLLFAAGGLLPSLASIWADIRLHRAGLRRALAVIGLIWIGSHLLWLFCLYVYCPSSLVPWHRMLMHDAVLIRRGPVFLSGLCLFLGLNR